MDTQQYMHMRASPSSHPRNRARSRGRGNQNTVLGILSRDPFGILWVTLLFVAALITKWWFISPIYASTDNCLLCVVAISGVMAALCAFLPMAFWIAWTDRAPIGMGFYFSLIGVGLLVAGLYHKLTAIVISKLYFAGTLTWSESQATELLDQVIHHNSGFYLAVMMAYIALRMPLVRSIPNKLPVIGASLALLGCSSILILLGMKLS